MSGLRIVFAGTPPFGLACLDEISQSSHRLIGIYTQPDRPAGRGQKLLPSAIKLWAEQHQIPVYQPTHFKDENSISELKRLAPDVMVVIAYGLILPTRVLNIPRFGCINVHASLLPRWRGASPIQQAILHGDKETGITIMQMDQGMDTGDTLAFQSTPISQHDTAESLHDRLAQLACTPLMMVLDSIEKQTLMPQKQCDALATYAPKIKKEDALIDWTQSAQHIEQHIRAFSPWPIAYTHINTTIIRIYDAEVVLSQTEAEPGVILSADKSGILVAAGANALRIKKIQFPGGKPISIQDYLNGHRQELQMRSKFS